MKIKVSYGALTCTVQKNGNMGSYEEEDGQRIVIPYYAWVNVKPFQSSNSKEIKSIKIKNYGNNLLNPECMWYLGVGYFRDNYQAPTNWEHILHLRPDDINDYHDIAIFSSNDDNTKEYNKYACSRPLINNEQTCIFNTVQGPNQSSWGRQSIPGNEELVLIVFADSYEQNWSAIIDSNNIEVGFSGNFEIEVEYTDYGGITTSAKITEIFSTSSANQIQFSYKFTKCQSNALYYYYTSESEVIPEKINYEPQNQQIEKTWCKITSTPTTDTDNALIGSQTLTNLDSTKQYRVAVAGRIDDPDASEEGLLITISDEYDYQEYCCIASEIATLAPHPLVSVGTKITKTQMDTLRAYKNNTPTAVTQYSKITATTGNSYKTNSVSIGTKITADWYNGA